MNVSSQFIILKIKMQIADSSKKSIATQGANAGSNSRAGAGASPANEKEGSAAREQEKAPEVKKTLEILAKPLHKALTNKWDEDAERKKRTIVEERFTFFQIENKLRKIAAEAVESVRDRQNKESTAFRTLEQKVQGLARESNEHGTMIHALKGMHKTFDKVFADIGNLEAHLRLELGKVHEKVDVTEGALGRQEHAQREQDRAHRAEMLSVAACETNTRTAVAQMVAHKEHVSERLDDAIQMWTVRVAELEAPQTQMKATLETNNTLLQQLVEETNRRVIQTDVIDMRLKKAEVKLGVMGETKLNVSEFDKLRESSRATFEQLDRTWKRQEEALQKSVDWMLRYSWQAARNQVNKALTRVTRPLQLKDLFYANVPQEDVREAEADMAVRKAERAEMLANQPQSNFNSLEASLGQPPESLKMFSAGSEKDINPAIGFLTVRNVHEIDWDLLRKQAKEEWADIKQEQYDVVSKLTAGGPGPGSPMSKTGADSGLGGGKGKKGKKKLKGPSAIKLKGQSAVRVGKDKQASALQLDDDDEERPREKKPKKDKKDKKDKKEKRHRESTRGIAAETALPVTKADTHPVPPLDLSPQQLRPAEPSHHGRRSSRQGKGSDSARGRSSPQARRERKEKKRKEKDRITKATKIPSQEALQHYSPYELEKHARQIQSVGQSVEDMEMGQALRAPIHHRESQKVEQALKVQAQERRQSPSLPPGQEISITDDGDGTDENRHTLPSQQDSKLFMADSVEGPEYRQPSVTPKAVPAKRQQQRAASPDRPAKKRADSSASSSGSSSSSSSSSGSESDGSPDEYEEDEEETLREAADAEALGIDLTKYMKKEAFEFYKDKIEDRVQDLLEQIDIMEGKLQRDHLQRDSEYAKGVDIIEARLEEHMVPVRADVEILLKTRHRNKADDMLQQQKVLERFETIRREFGTLQSTVDCTLCPLVNCLLENQCIQMQAEEQDDLDRQKIALYGHTELLQKTAEMQAHKEKSLSQALETERALEASPRERRKREREAVAQVKRGSNFASVEPQQRAKTTTKHDIPALRIDALNNTSKLGDRDSKVPLSSPRAGPSTHRGNPGNASLREHTVGDASLMNEDLHLDQTLASMLNSREEDNLTKSFIESHLGALDPSQRLSLLKTAQTSYLHQGNWQKKKAEKRPIVGLDQKCLNCSQDVNHVAKLFKIACLAYKPQRVNHRGISFSRRQLLQIRKFLVGQAGQLILKSGLMQRTGLCTKKVFDDIYLHIQDQSGRGFDVGEEAEKQQSIIEAGHKGGQQVLLDFTFTAARSTAGGTFRPESLTTGQDLSYLDFAADMGNPRVKSQDRHSRNLAHHGRAANTGTVARAGDGTPTLGMQSCGVSDDLNMNAQEFAAWHSRQASIQLEANRRTKANVTTAPHRLGVGYIGSTHDSIVESDGTIGLAASPASPLKPHFAGPDLSVFAAKRHTVQPTYDLSKEFSNMRNPMQMGPAGRKALGKQGCAKEQQKQFTSHLHDAAKTNSSLRQQILDKAKEAPKSLLQGDARGGRTGFPAHRMEVMKEGGTGNSGHRAADFRPQAPGSQMTGRSRASRTSKSKASSHNHSVSVTLPAQSASKKQLPPLKTNPSDISSLMSEQQ